MNPRHLLILCVLLTACARDTHPQQVEIQSLLDRYFTTWTAQGMQGYAACFDPAAQVLVVEKDGRATRHALTDFVRQQAEGHRSAGNERMTETPTFTRLSGDGRVAVAEVGWRITRGPRAVTGVDYFTLARQGRQWRIVALVFYHD